MVSDRERRDIVTALKNIIFLEDDETGEEYCEVGDILDALDVLLGDSRDTLLQVHGAEGAVI